MRYKAVSAEGIMLYTDSHGVTTTKEDVLYSNSLKSLEEVCKESGREYIIFECKWLVVKVIKGPC